MNTVAGEGEKSEILGCPAERGPAEGGPAVLGFQGKGFGDKNRNRTKRKCRVR